MHPLEGAPNFGIPAVIAASEYRPASDSSRIRPITFFGLFGVVQR